MTRFTLPAAFALIAAAVPFSASAETVCVQIDEKNDTLSESDRRGALAVARAAFVKAGTEVASSPCENQYTITNSTLGETIFVTMSGPRGQRDAKALKVDELGDLYQQMAKSLVQGVPMGEAVGRNNVTSRQQNPKRMTADSVYWFGLGPAYFLAVNPDAMPLHFTGGWRYELDQFGLEVNMGFTFAGSEETTASGETIDEAVINGGIGLAGFWFADEEANNTPYFGLGLGWSGTAADTLDGTYSGNGLQGTLSGGFEMLRASTIRAFVQIDAVLPMYELTLDRDTLLGNDPSPDAPDARYAPLFMLKIGVGWSPRGGIGFRAW